MIRPHFLFIIPLTPKSMLNEERKIMQSICIQSLISQDYGNWTALMVGSDYDFLENKHPNFRVVNYEGVKEEKLQIATQIIEKEYSNIDYLIRLDDDDVFNPNILGKVYKLDFDLYVDKRHYFWSLKNGNIACSTRLWYPNTFIAKKDIALKEVGYSRTGNFKKFRDETLVIENSHDEIHNGKYFKKIRYSKSSNPVYLRTMSSTSITAGYSNSEFNYLNFCGIWRKNNLKNFSFLPSNNSVLINQGLNSFRKYIFIEFRNRLLRFVSEK